MYSVVRLATCTVLLDLLTCTVLLDLLTCTMLSDLLTCTMLYNVVNCLPVHTELTSVVVDVGKGSGGGPETIVSSRWARDDDINRMIR